ncbi:1-(5-phosphoribosyl)-5-[(5-phosphoribosylamino)methylideneamino]imidazole-4-carboxamide isomerase [Parvularcula bermudensis]|uniref:1-(5-phosphoribosyl)-5-[(5- phosphoribosylamino)methylideneamino]imidazole-4- carboxamide isomerase n=1 Tax=Parvularcula bermudensis TaxID=208216 RepID=UPI000313B299|nr:1-(5-phosphoribosyl)-5-[(5-phosphoribosylamino)methylideneamino]imidazole-4-carboxamide isomerase [Parvularcula bermudensis]
MSFDLWPAIDLKEGECVRLLKGEMDSARTYGKDPAAMARRWRDAGFDKLHVVDLDGAFAGKPANAAAVEAILKETDAEVELGGGIRSLDTIERWLSLGVARIILGTIAVKDPDMTTAALTAFPSRIVLGLDARQGQVATEGWGEASSISAEEVLDRYDRAAIAAVVYTDIDRDGALSGVNLEATAALARTAGVPVLASGGIKDLTDIEGLVARQGDGIAGAILGRSLYEGTLDPTAALNAAEGAP